MKKIKILYLLPIAAMVFAGCEKKNKDTEPEQQQPSGDQQQAKTFEGLSLANVTVPYDGQAHAVAVQGTLPEGATVSYGDAGNSFTEPGVYPITATVSCTGYTSLTLNATLTINKLDFEGITFQDVTVAHDGANHSVEVNVPAAYEGATITYSDENEQNNNTFKTPGMHIVNVTVSKEHYNDWTGSAKLIIGDCGVATDALNVVDFEDYDDSELTEKVEFKRWDQDNNTWATPSVATISIADNQEVGVGSKTMKMTLTHQGYAFKATKKLTNTEYKKYAGFSLDTLMDDRTAGGEMKVSVQLWFKNLPLPDEAAQFRNTWATYTLSNNAPGIWTHWEIPFNDESLSIANQSHANSVAMLGQIQKSVADLSAYIDEIALICTPNYKDGGNCIAYFDNVKLTLNTERSVEKFIKGGSYGYESDSHYYHIEMNEDLTGAAFYVDHELKSELTAEKQGEQITLKDVTYAGNGLTVVGHIEDDGSVTVSSVAGLAQEDFNFLQGLRFYKHAKVNYDFTGKTVGQPLSDSHWKQEKYQDGWQNVTNQMNVREWSGHNVYGNMTTTSYMDFRYTYDNALEFGLANRFSIDFANDFHTTGNDCEDIKVKVKLITTTGQEVFVVGSASEYYVVPKDTYQRNSNDWLHIEKADFGTINVKALVVTVKSTKAGTDYLYVDNIKLSYFTPYMENFNNRYYLWNGSTDAFRMDITADNKYALLTKVGAEGQTLFDVTVEGANVTFADHNNAGAGLTIVGAIDGSYNITVSSVTGQAASIWSGSLNTKTFKRCADVKLDFQDGAGSGSYSNALWSEQRYDSNWVDVDPVEMNSRNDDHGSRVANLVTGSNARNFIFTPALPMGPVSHIDIDLGNYFSTSSDPISYKICVIDGGGNKKYAAGDGSNFATIAKDTTQGNTLHHFSFDFSLCVGYKLQITTKAAGTSYLYIDNIVIR